MKRITSILAAATLTLSVVACSDDPTIVFDGGETAPPTGVLTLKSTNWVKSTSATPTVTDYEVAEGMIVTTDAGQDLMVVESLTADEITVTLDGWYRTPSETGENPTLTLDDGQSVSYSTDSEDAGTNYVLTYNSN